MKSWTGSRPSAARVPGMADEQIVLAGKPGNLRTDARTLLSAGLRIDRRRFLSQIFFLIFAGVVGGFNLLLLVPIVNAVANPDGTMSLPLVGELPVTRIPLWVLLAAFILTSLGQALITRASAINAAALQPRIVDRLRHQAFEAILRADWEFVLRQRRSDIISVVTIGASRCGIAFQQLMQGSVNVVLAVVTAAVAIFVAPSVALLALVGVLILGSIQLIAIRPAHRLGRELGARSRDLQGVMQDSMDSLRLVRAHDAADVWVKRLGDAFAATRSVQIANVRRQSTAAAFSSVALAVAASVLVLVGVNTDVPPAEIVVVLVLVARLARLVQNLATSASQLANSLPAVGEIAELTNAARAAAESPHGVGGRTGQELNSHDPLVELRDVTYRYANSENGIKDVSLRIPAGQVTALAGHSGAGKSTVVDVVLGLLTPQSGSVLVDGAPLTASDLTWWRRHVAYVPQETVLIPATLRENLTWSSHTQTSDDRCWEALSAASAHFARNLPEGLDTVLGDRGLRLSGGERQRVAIARALLREPALLVLDEATSSLDDRTEQAVLSLIDTLRNRTTVLLIAHRQSTLDKADNVVRLEAGRVS